MFGAVFWGIVLHFAGAMEDFLQDVLEVFLGDFLETWETFWETFGKAFWSEFFNLMRLVFLSKMFLLPSLVLYFLFWNIHIRNKIAFLTVI